MTRRPVALLAGALLTLVTVGCAMPPPPPGVTLTVTADTAGATAFLSKYPSNSADDGITNCAVSVSCTFNQTAAEMAAAPLGYVVTISAATDFDYWCTAGQATKTDAFAATGAFVGFCAYSDEPPAVGIGVHNPALAPGSTTAITVDLTP